VRASFRLPSRCLDALRRFAYSQKLRMFARFSILAWAFASRLLCGGAALALLVLALSAGIYPGVADAQDAALQIDFKACEVAAPEWPARAVRAPKAMVGSDEPWAREAGIERLETGADDSDERV